MRSDFSLTTHSTYSYGVIVPIIICRWNRVISLLLLIVRYHKQLQICKVCTNTGELCTYCRLTSMVSEGAASIQIKCVLICRECRLVSLWYVVKVRPLLLSLCSA